MARLDQRSISPLLSTSPRELVLVLLLAACGGPQATTPGSNPPTIDTPAGATPSPAPASGPRYQASGTVLEKDGRGAQLCLGAIATSLPPQCSGLPIVGWDWSRVEREQTAQTTTWGEYHLVGTFDGKSFTPTQPPGPPQPPQPIADDTPRITTPCSEPAGGWQRPDPKRTGREPLDKANSAAQAQTDFAGLWIHDPNPTGGERQDMKQIVLNVAFTGDLERHTKELRKHWGGALCVVQHARTEAELLKIQEAAQKTTGELGLIPLDSMTDIVTGVVRIDVVFADASLQAQLDERHGAGAVVVSSRLRPAP